MYSYQSKPMKSLRSEIFTITNLNTYEWGGEEISGENEFNISPNSSRNL